MAAEKAFFSRGAGLLQQRVEDPAWRFPPGGGHRLDPPNIHDTVVVKFFLLAMSAPQRRSRRLASASTLRIPIKPKKEKMLGAEMVPPKGEGVAGPDAILCEFCAPT